MMSSAMHLCEEMPGKTQVSSSMMGSPQCPGRPLECGCHYILGCLRMPDGQLFACTFFSSFTLGSFQTTALNLLILREEDWFLLCVQGLPGSNAINKDMKMCNFFHRMLICIDCLSHRTKRYLHYQGLFCSVIGTCLKRNR